MVSRVLANEAKLLNFESFWITFEENINFSGRWDSLETGLEPKTKPPQPSLLFPNQWKEV